MAVSFPSSPTLYDTYTVGSKTWVWNGYAWDIVVGSVASAYNTANDAYLVANAAFDKANTGGPGDSMDYPYVNNAVASANAWANTIGAASNAWANTIGTSGNSYSVTVGAASNTWANTVGTASNAWANTIGDAGNTYAGMMVNSANAWANTKLSNTDNVVFNGSLQIANTLYAKDIVISNTMIANISGNINTLYIQNDITHVNSIFFATNSITSANGSVAAGQVTWNPGDVTLDVGTGQSILQLGQEQYYRVLNQSGETIYNANAVAYLSTVGNSGKLTVRRAIANNSYDSKYILGIATQDIPNGEEGFVTTFGKVRKIDTSMFSEGDILYVSSSTSGALQNTKPSAPNNKVQIGTVITKSSTTGLIFVAVQRGSSLADDELANFTALANGDLIRYVSANGRFENVNENITGPAVNAAAAFDKANSANVLAYDTGIGANAYVNVSTAAANNWANTVSGAANNYAGAMSNSSNNYAGYMANSVNSYIITVGAASNAWTNTVSSAANSYINTSTGAANSWANSVGAASNSWSNSVGIASNTYAGSMANSVNSNVQYSLTGANNFAGTMANSANSYASSTYYAKSGGTISGDVIITGNLTISGNTTYANTQTLLIGDNILTLNADLPLSVAPSENAGIEVNRGNKSANAQLIWIETTGQWAFTDNNQNVITTFIASNTTVENYAVAANSYAGAMANSSNAYAASLTPDLSPAFNKANDAYTVANGAFDKANSANVLAYNTGIGANAYTNTVGTAGNNYTDVVGLSANAYAGYMANSANAYAASLTPDLSPAFNKANDAYTVANGAFDKANSANVLAYDTGIGANAWANTVSAAANSYAGYMANSANAYAASLTPDLSPAFNKANDAYTVANGAFDKANSANVLAYNTGIGANNYAGVMANSSNSYAGVMANSVNANIQYSVAGANNYAGVMTNSSNSFAGSLANSSNSYAGSMANSVNVAHYVYANSVGIGSNNYAGVMANSSNSFAGFLANSKLGNVAAAGPISILFTQSGSNTVATINVSTSGVSACTYGGSTQIPYFTVDSYGRITDAANVSFTSGQKYTGSSSIPSTPSTGDEWFDSANGILYTYVADSNSSQWVELGPYGLGAPGPTGNTGNTGNAATIVIDTSTIVEPNISPSVTNQGNTSAANLKFSLPRAYTLNVNTSNTLVLSPNLTPNVFNSGNTTDFILNFGIPRAYSVNVNTINTITLVGGSQATVTNSGNTTDFILNFGIPRGNTGDRAGQQYIFNTATSNANPGLGQIAFDNGTVGSVTNIFANNFNNYGANVDPWLHTFDESTSTTKGTLMLMGNGEGSNTVSIFTVNSHGAPAGYHAINVTYLAGTLPTSGQIVTLQFSRTGDKGETGSTGAAGAPGDIVANNDTVTSNVWNTVSQTTVKSFNLPTNPATNTVFRIEMTGTYLNNSGSNRTLRLLMKLGTTTIFDSGVSGNLAANAARRRFHFIGQISIAGASSQKGFMYAAVGPTTAWGAATAETYGNGTAAENLSTTKAFALDVIHSSAATTISLDIDTFTFEQMS